MPAISAKIPTAMLGCLLVFGIAFCLSWSFGGARAFPWQLLQTAPHSDIDPEMLRRILWNIRLPRVFCACLVGAASAAAGVIAQGLFRNPLASPSVIGISSGGVLGAILAFYFGLNALGFWLLPIMALVGCLLTTLIILHFARETRSVEIENLLLVGFGLNGIMSAFSSFILSISLNDFDKAPAMMSWMLGSLSGKTWNHALVAVLPTMIGIGFAHRLAYRLNILSLGSDQAQTLGLDLRRLRVEAVVLISILVASSISIAGLMPFVGLLVPHVSRLLVGPDHRHLLHISVVNGMTLMLLADMVARIIIPPQEIQVGVLISLIGSPFFLWMLYKRRRSSVL